jgi:ATP-binding protein involved in chromosome partitioning
MKGEAMKDEQAEMEREQEQALKERMEAIGHKILVLSGKGGVGKSTVAVNLALALQGSGRDVGLLDVDIHGPSVPTMLGLQGQPAMTVQGAILPMEFEGIEAMSLGFFLQGADDAVIWRGPMKYGAIEQLLRDVEWGALDYLVIDCPPGTGDEPLSVIQLIHPGSVDGAVIVTTPQDVALLDVRRSIRFCEQVKLPVLGIVENMSGFTCPSCGAHHDIFSVGGGHALALELQVPFLGAIPIDPAVVESGDIGTPVVLGHPESETAEAFQRIAVVLIAAREDAQ